MVKRYFLTVCQNQRCIGNGTLMTGFIFNDENRRCEACGNVAAALAMVRFYSTTAEKDRP
jgi:aspartate carbamoyltransferase regulatory subunit